MSAAQSSRRRGSSHDPRPSPLGPPPLGHASYLAAIRALPRKLPREEERALAERMRAGGPDAGEARVRLLESLLWWAARCAHAYVTERASHEDLTQAANLALWRALPGYEPRSRNRVVTYVTPWILRDVRAAASALGMQVRRPRWVLDLERRLDRILAAHLAETGHAPTEALLAAALDVPLPVARRARAVAEARPEVVSLDHLTRASDVAAGPEALYERREEIAAVRAAVARAGLDGRELRVLSLLYGEERSLREAGAAMNLSHEWVRRLHERALAKLRAYATEHGGDGGDPHGGREGRVGA